MNAAEETTLKFYFSISYLKNKGYKVRCLIQLKCLKVERNCQLKVSNSTGKQESILQDEIWGFLRDWESKRILHKIFENLRDFRQFLNLKKYW